MHSEVQRAHLKAVEEERHRVHLEFREREHQVKKLRAKYEATVRGRPDDEESGVASQSYYVIQAAQRREELQRHGDELDQEIRKREKESRALEATLKHLNVRNSDFRKSFQQADMTSKDANELRHMEEQAKVAQDALFKKKKTLQRLQTDFEEDGRRLEQVQRQTDQLNEHNMHLEQAHKQVAEELDSQKADIEGMAAKLYRLSAAHRRRFGRSGAPSTEESVQEKTFRVGLCQETTDNVLYTLGQLVRQFPEMHDELQMHLQRLGLVVPSRPPSRAAMDAQQES